ncbi:MAG: cell morphology protein [Planctomycetaceae bacterium]|nr:cell morphology protein [Planctomycetaceae bacterium]
MLWLQFLTPSLFAADSVLNPYRTAIQARFAEAEQSKSIVVQGTKPWLFFTPELRALTVGPFWGPDAAGISRTTNPLFADPLAPIVDFNDQLKLEGIELLLVPVPAKAAIYPELLIPGVKSDVGNTRIDSTHTQFYKLLQQRGVKVLDLQSDFLKQKRSPEDPLFCRTDSHWSGRGTQVAAEAIGTQIKLQPWYQQLRASDKFERGSVRVEPLMLQIKGDLAILENEQQPAEETLELSKCLSVNDGQKRLIPTVTDSPVLLLGDSHTLVFHDPALFAEGCGLADHLARVLELRLDLIGVRGSGANAARISWRRRPDPLKGKKLVIWCFSMREFTENTDGWKKIPIKRPQ